MTKGYDLAGKVVLITGAGGGLGSRLARVLSQRGALVALIDIDLAAAHRAASALHEGRVIALGGDVTDLNSMRRRDRPELDACRSAPNDRDLRPT